MSYRSNVSSSINSNNERNRTMNNRYFDNANFDVTNPAPRCPVILLLDISGSMYGQPISELNSALRQFIRETSSDEAASRSVELEIITFDSTAKVVQPFAPILGMAEPAPLVADGSTAMGAGIKLALRDLKARRKLYRDNGYSSYRPWVVLMTDGEPNDTGWEDAAAELHSLGENGKIQYIGIEIGERADDATMRRIIPTPGPVIMEGLQFKDFFRWLTDSLSSVSVSTVEAEGTVQFGGIDSWGTLRF